MSLVTIKNIKVLSIHTSFDAALKFEITFHCTRNIEDSLEWKMIYVGSAESESFDQVLSCISVGPIPPGLNRFVFESKAPDIDLIPKEEVVGVTIILITCSYMKQEFLRVGYYIDVFSKEHVEHPPEQMLDVTIDQLSRVILEENSPRVTYFPIRWSDSYTEIPEAVVDEDFVDDEMDEINPEEELESDNTDTTDSC